MDDYQGELLIEQVKHVKLLSYQRVVEQYVNQGHLYGQKAGRMLQHEQVAKRGNIENDCV